MQKYDLLKIKKFFKQINSKCLKNITYILKRGLRNKFGLGSFSGNKSSSRKSPLLPFRSSPLTERMCQRKKTELDTAYRGHKEGNRTDRGVEWSRQRRGRLVGGGPEVPEEGEVEAPPKIPPPPQYRPSEMPARGPCRFYNKLFEKTIILY
ncbi:hypothetical protein AAG570_003025 [Ranatra chinensis]|uniref:Uncharacterized protein n=1 Tax=Ranatra chinensis TaxID=642074 RepID=A0ABD0YNI7_9HEMI